MREQLMLFDRDYEMPLSHETTRALNWAQQVLLDYLHENDIQTKLLDLESIDFNFQSSPGAMYRDKVKTKGELLTNKHTQLRIKQFMEYKGVQQECWSLSPKRDYLPLKKVYANNFRCFEIPPLPTLARALSVSQAFNKQLYTLCGPDSPIKVGSVFQHGGFNALFRSLESRFPRGFFGEGDCEKYDKTLHNELRRRCRDIRKACTFGERKAHIQELLDVIYYDCMNAYVSLPWGQVVRLVGGMLSGDGNTTSDNTLAHLMVVLAMIKYHRPDVSSFRSAMEVFFPCLYSDDHLFATLERHLSLYAVRSEFYARFGLKLKEEDDKVQENVEGLKFLGATAHRDQGMYCPRFDKNRIFSAIVESKSTLLPREYYNKVLSLLYLATYTDRPFWSWLAKYLRWHIKNFDDTYPNWFSAKPLHREDDFLDIGQYMSTALVPTWDDCDAFWRGNESVGLAHPHSRHKIFMLLTKENNMFNSKTIVKTVSNTVLPPPEPISVDATLFTEVVDFSLGKFLNRIGAMADDLSPKQQSTLMGLLGKYLVATAAKAETEQKYSVGHRVDLGMASTAFESVSTFSLAPTFVGKTKSPKLSVQTSSASNDARTRTVEKNPGPKCHMVCDYCANTTEYTAEAEFDGDNLTVLFYPFSQDLLTPDDFANLSITDATTTVDHGNAFRMQTVEKNPGPDTCKWGDKCNGKNCKIHVRKNKLAPIVEVVEQVKPVVQPHVKQAVAPIKAALKVAKSRMDSETKAKVSAICTAISMPEFRNPVRWGTEFGSDPTALCTTMLRMDATFGNPAAEYGGQQLRPTETMAFAFKCLERAAIVYDPNVAGTVYNGTFYGVGNDNTALRTFQKIAPSDVMQVLLNDNETLEFKVPYMRYNSSWTPHSPIQFAGTDNEGSRRYLWLDPGFINITMAINGVSTALPAGDYMVHIRRLMDDTYVEDDVRWTISDSVSVSNQFTVTCGGYYCVALTPRSTAGLLSEFTATIQMTFTSRPCEVWKHLPAQDFGAKAAVVDGSRITALSLMYTNDSSFNGREGKMAAFQMPAKSSWMQTIPGDAGSAFDKVSLYSANSENVNRSDNGWRIWAKMKSYADWDMVTHTDVENGVLYDSYYPINPLTDYLTIVASVTNAAGQDGYWTIYQGVEFMTRDAWFNKRESNYTKAEMDLALSILRDLPQYTTNEFHLRDIWNAIVSGVKTVAQGAIEHGPTIMKIARLLI